MVSQITLFVVVLIIEISIVHCKMFKKCCASNEGLQEISFNNSTRSKYVCTSEFNENVLPLKFRNLNNIVFGIPQTCGRESCIDKTVDGEKILELLCANKEKLLTTEIPTIYKCCSRNSTFNVFEKKCDPLKSYNDTDLDLYDLESEAQNVIINISPQCDEYLVDIFIEVHDITFYNGKLTTQFQDKSLIFEKESYCFDLNLTNNTKKIFIRSCKMQITTHSQIKKCCKENELLEFVNNKYVCTSKTNKVLPLQSSEKINFGIPKTCGSATCIDKKSDQTIAELFCDRKEKNPGVKLPTIYKCCPLNMTYDEFTKSCVLDDASENQIFDSSAPIYNLVFGTPTCNTTMAFVDYRHEGTFSIDNGTLTLNNSKIFENGTYCIDINREHHNIIRTCEYAIDTCRNRSCVPKCCAPTQTLMKPPKGKSECVEDFTTPFFSSFTNSENKSVGMPENLPIISSILRDVNCKRYVSTAFQLYENSTLYAATASFQAIDRRYCIESLNTGAQKMYIALICFPAPKVTGLHNFYYLGGLLISIKFLAITLAIYFCLPELQNLHGRTVMSHSTSLLASYIFLAMVKRPLTSYTKPTCIILGYGIMYTFLVAFAWLNVMCFDIWYTFGVVRARGMKKHNDLKKFLLYSLYAYGIPLIITGVTLYIDLFADIPSMFKPNFGQDACWFDLRLGKNFWPYTIFFGIPVATIIFFNIVLFTLTVKNCLKVRGDIQRMQHADSPKKRRFFTDKATLIMNFKLFIVMGISWIFEIISMYIREPIELWYFLDSINVLQGLWIFCIFVLKDNVWKALRKKLGYHVIREGSQTQSTVLSAKNSVASTTSLRINGITKPEEKDLLQNAIRNAASPASGKSSKDSMLK